MKNGIKIREFRYPVLDSSSAFWPYPTSVGAGVLLQQNLQFLCASSMLGGSGVNILHKWVKLFPDGHFQAHKLFPEMMRESRLFSGYFAFF